MVNFFSSFFEVATCFSSFAVEEAFSAARSVKVAFSLAAVLSTADDSRLDVFQSSSDFLRSDIEGDWADFLDSSLGRGFLASLILKPGGGPVSPP